MFALDVGADAVKDVLWGPIFPGSRFVRALVEKGCLREKVTPASDAADGDILIYYRNGNPEHAGKWKDNRVVSKWGSGPTHIWDHNVYEVPESYGDEVRVFEPEHDAVRLYKIWAKANGI